MFMKPGVLGTINETGGGGVSGPKFHKTGKISSYSSVNLHKSGCTFEYLVDLIFFAYHTFDLEEICREQIHKVLRFTEKFRSFFRMFFHFHRHRAKQTVNLNPDQG